MNKPMHALDALFLHAENGVTHMHIGSCSTFEGPAPSIDDMTQLIESKLPHLVRYRQVVRFVPAGLGHPVWVDDPHFNLSYHVRHSALPPPGDESDLENLMGRLMSQPLDRRRPLWETWMIEGLAGGRWALISKVHHCMVDGISGAGLMTLILDADPAAKTPAIKRWAPAPGPSDVQLALGAIVRLASTPARQVLALRFDATSARRARDQFGEVTAGLRSFGARTKTPPRLLSIEGDIGPHRRWAGSSCTLADIKIIRTALGGSVNDVVLAAISGAFRALLIERGDPIDDNVVLRSLVPVSVRAPDDRTANNQVSIIVAELPIGIADPRERLRAVSEQMGQLKSSHQATAGEAVVAAADFLPPPLLAFGTRVIMSLARKYPQRGINTVTTNVPGPRFALYALGREMVEYFPFVPLSDGVRIGVAILSYNGQVAFGISGDYDTAPDVHFMAKQIEVEVEALRKQAVRLNAASAKRAKGGAHSDRSATGSRRRRSRLAERGDTDSAIA
jgi:WS/DGAT/MGAT family acyltransferase